MPEITHTDPKTLKSNPWNSNVVSPENEEKLDQSILRFGFFKPIIVREVDGELEILGGQHRWESAIRLGLPSVPVFNVGEVDDARAKEISLADNARYGADDSLLLAELVKDLSGDELQSFLPYSDDDVRGMFSSDMSLEIEELELDENIEKGDETEAPKEAKTARTHNMMRFKVPVADSERIAALIGRTQKTHGYTAADELTNAGDALVHLLLTGGGS